MIPEWHTEQRLPHAHARRRRRAHLHRHRLARPPRAAAHARRRSSRSQLAVTHGGFGTAERIDSAQALEAYTVGSAAAEGMEDKKGTLAPGMFADLVVLSADPTAVAPDKIGAIEVLMTMVGGRVVYRRGGFAAPPPPTIGAPRPPPPPTIGPPRPPQPRRR